MVKKAPAKKKAASKGRILHMRSHHQPGLKTAALLMPSVFELNPVDKAVVEAQFEEQCQQQIETHRQVASVAVYGASGLPSVVTTPGGSRLKLGATYGSIRFFDNDENRQPAKSPVASKSQEMKKQVVTVTREMMEKVHGPRSVSQRTVMGNLSVTDHIKAIEELSQKNVRWEWLHLIAYSILGAPSQRPENLVGGTKPSNTEMMSVESQVRELIERHPNGIEVTVTANMLNGSQIANQIVYEIKADGLAYHFEFDTMAINTPHISRSQYVRNMVDSVEDAADKEPERKVRRRL